MNTKTYLNAPAVLWFARDCSPTGDHWCEYPFQLKFNNKLLTGGQQMAKATGTQKWEQSDHPMVCEGCLGTNPHLRMTKEAFGQECRVCLKPHTLFRWSPGPGMKFRRTEICQTCARLKNICQSCMFDLRYGLPVQVRDGVLGLGEAGGAVPKDPVNREYFMAINASKLARGDLALIDYERANPAGHAVLAKLSERVVAPKLAKKNLPPPCSFYAKGSCSRGPECPFRHQLVHETSSTLKTYRSRYFGQDDIYAEKLISRHSELLNSASAGKPQDPSVSSLFVSGLREPLDPQRDLAPFFAAYGAVRGVKVVGEGTAALVTFRNREAAEEAAEQTLGDATLINGVSVRVSWAKSRVPPQEDTFKWTATDAETPPEDNDRSQRIPQQNLLKRLKR